MVAHVRPATTEDCNTLGPLLRKADKEELMLSCGHAPVKALTLSMEASDMPYVACDEDGIPFAMFGVVGAEKGFIGVPWMLGSSGIYKHAIQFKRECNQWLDTISEDYLVLVNYVHADNHKAIRWLQWLGFKLIHLDPEYGVGKAPFYEFVKVKENV